MDDVREKLKAKRRPKEADTVDTATVLTLP